MGTYTKASIIRAARPRSERLRELGGSIVSTSVSVMGGLVPSGEGHSHANLADLNMITVTDGYVYLTDTYTDETTGDQVTERTKVKAGFADTAEETRTGSLTLSGTSLVPRTDSTCNIGTSSKRFSDGSIRNLHVTTFDFRDGSSPSTQIGGIYCGGSIMQLQLGSGGANGYYNFGSTTGVFHNGNGTVPCGRSDHRWSGIFSVDADLSGNLSLAQNSHIDIGPLRIEYDATNKALHVTKASSSDQNTYGLYADGFVAAGGTGQTS